MLATRWNPWRELFELDREMDRMFGQFLGRSRDKRTTDASFVPAVDVLTRDKDLVIRAELPGVDPDKDVDITLTDGMLKIQGRREHRQESTEHDVVRIESFHGSFERMIPVPEAINAEDIQAKYHQGILEIVVPGAVELNAPKRIPVLTNGRQSALTVGTTESDEQAEQT